MKHLSWDTCGCGREKVSGRRVCEVCEAERADQTRRAFERRSSPSKLSVVRETDPALDAIIRSINQNAEKQRRARKRADALAGFTAWVLVPLALLCGVLIVLCGLASLLTGLLHSLGGGR